MNNVTLHPKLLKKVLSLFLALIIGFTAFVTMTFSNVFLSDYVAFMNLITADAAELSPVPMFYRHGELVGIYRVNYSDKTPLQYKIGEDGDWTSYSVPFAVPAHKTTKVYARIGEQGKITYMNFSNSDDAIGVYTESNTDFEFSYNNINFDYTRIYSSADKDWFESIHSKVLVTSSRLEVTLPDSSKYPMIRKDNDTYVDELNGYTLTKTDSDYVFDDGQYKYYFAIKSLNSVAYLSAIEDYSGNRLNLNRTANTEEISISDGAGRSFALSDYYAVNAPEGSDVNYYSVKEITDPNNNKIEYTTKFDRYIQIKDQAGVILGKYEYKNPTDYALTKSMDKTIEYYDNGRLKQITYDNGSWIKYTYDDDNMLYTTLTSSDEATKTVYNDAFLPVEYTDEYGTKTEYTYDDYYRIKTEKIGDEITTYNYDSKGNILSYITGDAENDTYYTYDSKGNVIREQNGKSYSYYTYNENNDVLVSAALKEEYSGDIPDVYDSSLNCFDTTSYTYDSKGRVTKEENSSGSVYQYEYDESGNVLKETITAVEEDKTETTVTSYTYDELGNVLTTQCDKDTSSYVYDKAGRTLLAIENGDCTRTIYDEYGRIVQEIEPQDYDASKDGLPNENTYSDSNVGQRYVYNDKNQLEKEINRLDVTTHYAYYSTGEKKQETFDIYKYEYAKNGNVQNVYIGGKTSSTGGYTGGDLYAKYNYDAKGNLDNVTYGNGQIVSYEYNSFDQVTKQFHQKTASSPKTTQFAYEYKAADKAEDSTLVSKYDYNINQKTVYSDNGLVTIYNVIYDDNGAETLDFYYSYKETEQKEDNGTVTPATLEQNIGSLAFTTVKNENADVFKLNNDNLFTYSISDEGENSSKISVKNNEDINVYNSEYEYNEKGLVTKITTILSGGFKQVSSYDYDSKGRIIYYAMNGQSDGINDHTDEHYYTYDEENGNLLREDFKSSSRSESIKYTYDSRGNLKSIKKYNYTRDELVDDPNTSEHLDFEYDNTAWLDIPGSMFGEQVLYDENGNLVELGDCEAQWTNGRQLSKIIDKESGTDVLSYTYDENGIRTSKTYCGETTYYTTIDGTITSQYTIDENGDKKDEIEFIYNSSNEAIAARYEDRTYYYVKNAMGDVESVVNQDGKVLEYAQYNAWGSFQCGYIPVFTDFTDKTFYEINPIRYRGYYFDDEMEMYYLQSRYYLSQWGRFFNSDLPEYAQVQKNLNNGTNLFAYCCNDPVNDIDPNGTTALSAVLGAVLGMVFGAIGFFLEIIIDDVISNNSIDKIKKTINAELSSVKGKVKLLVDVLMGGIDGALSQTNKFKLFRNVYYAVSKIKSVAGIRDGFDVLGVVIELIVDFIISKRLNTAETFKKFNSNQIKNKAKTLSSKFGGMSKSKIKDLVKLIKNQIKNYIKENKKVYKRFITNYSLSTVSSWTSKLPALARAIKNKLGYI